jgi:hypothetical protein
MKLPALILACLAASLLAACGGSPANPTEVPVSIDAKPSAPAAPAAPAAPTGSAAAKPAAPKP